MMKIATDTAFVDTAYVYQTRCYLLISQGFIINQVPQLQNTTLILNSILGKYRMRRSQGQKINKNKLKDQLKPGPEPAFFGEHQGISRRNPRLFLQSDAMQSPDVGSGQHFSRDLKRGTHYNTKVYKTCQRYGQIRKCGSDGDTTSPLYQSGFHFTTLINWQLLSKVSAVNMYAQLQVQVRGQELCSMVSTGRRKACWV